MYQITKQLNNDLHTVQIKDESSGELVEIIPSLGANVNRLILEKDEKLISVLRGYQKNSDFSGNNIFNGAKLFPFPNRLDGGKYSFENKAYKLEQNYAVEGNACHGFLYNEAFEITNQIINNSFAEVTFAYEYHGYISGYPFPFKIELSYRLQHEFGFSCRTNVMNLGSKAMPIGDGWHPFIKINDNVDDLFLKFQSETILNVNEKLIPTGKTESYEKFNNSTQIKDTSFDNCFLLRKNGPIHYTKIYDKKNDLSVMIWQETGEGNYNYLQIYIPPERDCIAIEPMTCAPNSFNNLKGLTILNSGDTFETVYGIKIN